MPSIVYFAIKEIRIANEECSLYHLKFFWHEKKNRKEKELEHLAAFSYNVGFRRAKIQTIFLKRNGNNYTKTREGWHQIFLEKKNDIYVSALLYHNFIIICKSTQELLKIEK